MTSRQLLLEPGKHSNKANQYFNHNNKGNEQGCKINVLMHWGINRNLKKNI